MYSRIPLVALSGIVDLSVFLIFTPLCIELEKKPKRPRPDKASAWFKARDCGQYRTCGRSAHLKA